MINAICGREVVVAGAGLAAVTHTINPHVTEGKCRMGSHNIHHKHTFWDTPGFESCDEHNIRSKIKKIFKTAETNPVCMLFCALVCTNKYAGSVKSRRAVIDDFKELLSKYVDDPPREDTESQIIRYGSIGLCASVNSEPYEDDDRILPPCGVNELIYTILDSLIDDEVLKWVLLILENKEFWKSHTKSRNDI